MAFQPAPNVALVEVLYDLNGEQCENTYHFFRAAGWDVATLSNLVAAMATWAEDQVLPNLSNQAFLRAVRATDIATQISPSVQFDLTPPQQGGVLVQSLPNNCAFCITLRTNFRGRSARGRNYILGIPETEANASLVSEAFATAIQTAYQLLTGIASTFGASHAVLSRQSNGVLRPAAVAFEITGYEVTDRVVDSQRRRSPGRGT